MRHRGLALWIGVLVALLGGCMMGTSISTVPTETVSVADLMPTPVLFDSSRLPSVTSVRDVEAPYCPGAPRSRLVVNERGRVTDNGKTLNIRTAAGTEYEQIGRMPPGSIFVVVDGPRCSGTYAWFYILYQGMNGWIAEADAEIIYAQPYLDG